MRLTGDHSNDFYALDERTKQEIQTLLTQITPQEKDKIIPAQEIISKTNVSQSDCYFIKEGVLRFEKNGRLVLFFEEGDFVGLEHLLLQGVELRTDFAVVVDIYNIEDILKACEKNQKFLSLWTRYWASWSTLLLTIIGTLSRGQSNQNPEIRAFIPGEAIVKQGDPAVEVFTLLEGSAHVVVDGIEVGEILRDEIFGALATLGGTPRTASVIAYKPSTVLVLHRDHFIDLMSSRPTTVLKLVTDMARSIVSANQTMVAQIRAKL